MKDEAGRDSGSDLFTSQIFRGERSVNEIVLACAFREHIV